MGSKLDWVVIIVLTCIVLVGGYMLMTKVVLVSPSSSQTQTTTTTLQKINISTESDVQNVQANISEDISDIKNLLGDIKSGLK
ncbi:MAG: hypothetical protein J7J92_02220 [Candidatus Aenigmarchaeota archaeon]|nr:hypothetical protein [Candidatus Aenigmarchaeota archaeon]